MIPSVPVRLVPVRIAVMLAVMLGGSATAAYSAGERGAVTADPLVRSQTSDRYVNGHYDKTGTYVPPHYQPASKAPFHGYFFTRPAGGAQKPN